ncbi:hypothetical protein [Paenilisteria rocourtiae]|uniref:Uncharacterized protein n=1 Tax=Listeria rocourtiae TaxID=647910 RepID=A0A4R6ZTD6_9LIST|nr:hypothetical protein [Listeria rocourtiae]EUJ48083.1 hypothetical protein PROCOU_06268 [Listeria rocourtiae FSL F6-920]MBC1435644.1 hypothetical protein [Listeria rocourtiae]MBC1603214.1 hypothetical protein [Listeria rocourtiae]TDR55504.1 hypothetical protein DFP96_101441 [Listeria rocourtiae]
MKKFLISLGAIVIVLGGVLIYLNHMNYWPFQGDKIKGIADGEIKNMRVLSDSDEMSLLLAASGTLGYNVKAKSMTVCFDVYNYDKRVSHEMVTAVSGDKETQLSNTLMWGIPGFDAFKPSEIHVILGNGKGGSGESSLVIPKNIFGKLENHVTQTQPFDDEKIIKGKKYILQAWGMGKGDMGTNKEALTKKGLKSREQTVMLYIIFK